MLHLQVGWEKEEVEEVRENCCFAGVVVHFGV